jgi:hypothetical protein
MRTPYGLLSVLTAGLALSNAACTKTSCSRNPDSIEVSNGIVQGNVYRSADFTGPFAYFPPARTISFDHKLGVTPYAMQFWLAFSADGILAPSAGNMTELVALDDHQISVLNDTCSDFYLWVVAEAPECNGGTCPETDGGAPEAGAAAGEAGASSTGN